jgi:hypothetical protein
MNILSEYSHYSLVGMCAKELKSSKLVCFVITVTKYMTKTNEERFVLPMVSECSVHVSTLMCLDRAT